MKFLLIIFVSTAFALDSFSQDLDKRLLLKYSQLELEEIRKNDIKEYQFLLDALDRGLFISELPTKKGKHVVFDGELDINPNETHTFISLRKDILDRYQYFKIKGTNKMLVIQPRIFLDERILNSKIK